MTYQYLTQYTSPYGPPTSARKTSITIHHWGRYGQTFMGVVRYLCSDRPDNPTSAHDVIEAGRVACIVDPDNAAYHCGVPEGNRSSIGLELRPEATDGDYLTAAERIRDLRAVYGDLPLKRHSDWKATACPGKWDLARLDRLARSLPTTTPPPASDDVAVIIPEENPVRLISAPDRGVARIGDGYKSLSPAQVSALQKAGVPGPASLSTAEFDAAREACALEPARVTIDAVGAQQIAQQLAPLLSALPDGDLERIAEAVNDEASARLAQR